MPSEYDALLETPPTQQKSEYDALLTEPSPQSTPTFAPGSPREIAHDQLTAQPIVQQQLERVGHAVGQTAVGLVKGLPQMAKFIKPPSLVDVLGGAAETVGQMKQAVNAPVGSQDWWNAVVPLGAQAAMEVGGVRAASPGLHETLFGEKPPVQPLASETAAVEQIQKGGPSATEPNRQTGALPAEQGKPAQQEAAVQPETRDTRETPAEAPAQEVTAPVSGPTETTTAQPLTQEKISQVAIRNKDTGKVTTGVNHTDAYLKAHPDALDPDEWSGISKQLTDKYEHGFVTSDGKFVSRQEANVIAKGKTGELAHDEIPQKGGEVGEKVQVKGQDEGEREKGVLTPEAAKVQPPAATTGISNERLKEIYGDDAIIAGKGRGPQEWQRIGQADTRDPYAVLSKAQANGIAPPEDVALLRAEHQRLANAAREAYGTERYNELAQNATDMANSIKGVAHGPASDVMRALQDVDIPKYDSPADFDRIVRERMNRESTPEEKSTFEKVTQEVRNGDSEVKNTASEAQNRLARYRPKETISFEDAIKHVKDQIAELTTNCNL